MTLATQAVLQEVYEERRRQDAKWGEQNHEDGTGEAGDRELAERAQAHCARMVTAGRLTWRDILIEEFSEAFAERDHQRLREELIQCAAVCVAWAQAIDRRGAK